MMSENLQPDWSFRFFDNREKYLLFVSTCNQKQIIAERVAMDIHDLLPQPHHLLLPTLHARLAETHSDLPF